MTKIGYTYRTNRFFKGEIREVGIWDSDLSASEAAMLYEQGFSDEITQSATYGAAGRLLTLTDPVGNTTSYTYNYMGLVATETNEKNATRYYTYDALGRLISKTDRNDRITTYAYDSVGRLTAEHWGDTSDYFMYTYDLVGNLLYTTDGDHSYSYTYDSLYRPTHVSFNFDSQSAVFSYTYDAVGRQMSSSLTLNGHADRVNTTTYDYLGNATSIRQHGNITDEIFAEFDYNANGLLTAINRYEEDENDVLTSVANSLYEYNANNAVTSITHNNATGSQIVKHSYTYDETNNIIEYLNSLDGSTEYNYDFLGQLIGADHANQTDESYIYDSNGNRITANGSNYTTGDNNELTSDGDYTYTYDAEGNRISKSNSTDRELYEWDYRNRLTKVTQQTFNAESQTWETVQIVEYAYDYNNIWIRKTLDSNGDGTADSKTLFIPESYQTTVQLDDTDLTDSTGPVVTHHYLWTPNQQDKLLADTTTDDVLWSLTDHLGTVRDVLGSDDAHLIYDAFGNLISGSNPLLFGYTGKAFDTDTALQNNINRWYDANIGRWLSTDPIGFNGNDTNLYRYVHNKIVVNLDFNGEKCGECIPDKKNSRHNISPIGIFFSLYNPEYLIFMNTAKKSAELLGTLQVIFSIPVTGIANSGSSLGKVATEMGIDGVHQIPSIPGLTIPSDFKPNPTIPINNLKVLENYLSNMGKHLWILVEYQTCEKCCFSRSRGYYWKTHRKYYATDRLWGNKIEINSKPRYPSWNEIKKAMKNAVKKCEKEGRQAYENQ